MKKNFLWIFLFLVSGIIYYLIFFFTEDTKFIEEEIKIKRVIDGDSLEGENGEKIRLIGINTPEKKAFMSEEAKYFLKNFENKTVVVKYKERDKYGRILGYIFYEKENINEKILMEGFAHLFVYEKDDFYEELEKAEKIAREESKGIWRKSKNFGCVEIIEFNYKEKTGRCKNEERLVLKNKCDKFEILMKDEATHEFKEELREGISEFNFSCVFNDKGDSLFIWDNQGLVFFFRYP